MNVASQPVMLPADNQRGLAVCLEPGQAVGNVHPMPFELFCPRDVVFFVKAGLELDEYGNLGVVVARPNQRRNQGGVFPQAVQAFA